MAANFDLISYQQYVLDCYDQKEVYSVWDEVCTMRDRKQITEREWQEMRDTVQQRLARFRSIKDQLNTDKAGGETAK